MQVNNVIYFEKKKNHTPDELISLRRVYAYKPLFIPFDGRLYYWRKKRYNYVVKVKNARFFFSQWHGTNVVITIPRTRNDWTEMRTHIVRIIPAELNNGLIISVGSTDSQGLKQRFRVSFNNIISYISAIVQTRFGDSWMQAINEEQIY